MTTASTKLVPLTTTALETARVLAREGVREPVIRATLGLTPRQWKATLADESTGLAAALDVGTAEGAAEVVQFMLARMRDGSMRAAEWLGSHVFKLRPMQPSEDIGASVPRVIVNIGTPMSPEEYRRVIDVQPDTLPGPR